MKCLESLGEKCSPLIGIFLLLSNNYNVEKTYYRKEFLKKGNRLCHDESQKIINFLLSSYNANVEKNGKRKIFHTPEAMAPT